MSATCPWCSAPRDTGPTCPKCGAIYAKAEAIKAHGRAHVLPAAPEIHIEEAFPAIPDIDNPPEEWQLVDDAELEWKFCLAAIPVALVVAMLLHTSGLFASLQRIFLSMPVHELGHATAAWLCGYSAIPTVWKTLVPETRGFIAPIALLAAFGYMGWRGWLADNRVVIGIACALVLLQLALTLGVSLKTSRMIVVFSGDGGGMILATLLMGSFFFGKRTQLYKGSLRWGFVVIGATAFVDFFSTWVRGRFDWDAIPLGSQDGQDADPAVLVQEFGWTLGGMVNRYLALGILCLVALAIVYTLGVRRAARERDMRLAARRVAEREIARA
jgi:hypothetical protein